MIWKKRKKKNLSKGLFKTLIEGGDPEELNPKETMEKKKTIRKNKWVTRIY
jgi:hypothetical protein